jgi:nucleoside-diphosphate-sugar epimerase
VTARRVLVTGANGFVGTRLSRVLCERGFDVVGLDRVLPATDEARRVFGDFWQWDLRVDSLPPRAGAHFDSIVHLAGVLPGASSRAESFAVNAGGTSAVLNLAAAGTHLILFSTGLVYGDQLGPFRETLPCLAVDPYAQSKLCAETVVKSFGLATGAPVTILRPSVIYGPGAPSSSLLSALFSALRAGRPFDMTKGEQLRDFIHVDDAAAAVVAAIDRRTFGTFNLASGDSRRVREVALVSAQLASRPELLRIGALDYRVNEVFDYRLDPSAFAEAAGFRARVPLDRGLTQTWEETS